MGRTCLICFIVAMFTLTRLTAFAKSPAALPTTVPTTAPALSSDARVATEAQRSAASARHMPFAYEYGTDGTPQDFAKAVQYFRKAAESGDRIAMNNVGALYDQGKGVPQDYAQALAWFTKAAAGDDDAAMWHIGLLYENGRGVVPDVGQAIAWYQRAASLGNESVRKRLAALGAS